MKTIRETQPLDDAQLVERCRRGDREAFARIVERYQSLICALTYGGCGRLQASEDLAQVTFITAWRELPKLQEPARLKAWLCGIARNVLHHSRRQDRRAPTACAEPNYETEQLAADMPSPREQAISREEEAILWRVLHDLPANYRGPLVLFYREHRSAAAVAEALELTEETVHQRLSRGRAMLTERMPNSWKRRCATPGRRPLSPCRSSRWCRCLAERWRREPARWRRPVPWERRPAAWPCLRLSPVSSSAWRRMGW